jgi:hypothetical protein
VIISRRVGSWRGETSDEEDVELTLGEVGMDAEDREEDG